MTSQEIVQRQRDLVAFADDDKLKAELAEILPASVTVPVFIRGLKNAALQNPDILKADQASLYRAVLRAGMDGLIPDGRESAIVVMGGKAAYMPMIGGIRKVLAEFGWTLHTAVIYENDVFEDLTDQGKVVHRRPRPGVDRGFRVGAYAMAVHKDGRTMAEVYDQAKIEDVMKKSSRSKQIWQTWPDPMWEKTPAHRLAKKIPLDPKDRERMDSILSDDVDGEDAAVLLYGDRLEGLPPIPADKAGEGDAPHAPSPPPADEVAFEGEEPDDEPVDISDAVEIVEEEPPRFESGRHEGMTIQEVWDLGSKGEQYVRWAAKNWKTGAIVEALGAFVAEQPEEKA